MKKTRAMVKLEKRLKEVRARLRAGHKEERRRRRAVVRAERDLERAHIRIVQLCRKMGQLRDRITLAKIEAKTRAREKRERGQNERAG